MYILLQLRQNLLHILLPRQPIHNLQFCHLHVNRVIVFAEEDLDVVLEDGGAALDDEEDVAETDVLDFGAG